MTVAAGPAAIPVGRKLSRDDVMVRSALLVLIGFLLLTIAVPLGLLLAKSFQNSKGEAVGLANYLAYFSTPSLVNSLWNSIGVALLTTVIVIPLSFGYAYALTRTKMPAKGLFYSIALLPLFAPSLLSAISFIYIFGNQGFLKSWLFGHTVYGPIGIMMSQIFYCLPHAMLIITTALSLADGRLYEAADALGTSAWRVGGLLRLPTFPQPSCVKARASWRRVARWSIASRAPLRANSVAVASTVASSAQSRQGISSTFRPVCRTASRSRRAASRI